MNDITTTDLVSIDPADALTVFTTPGHIDPILAKVRAAIDSFKADTSTAAGRKAIASIAYKVAQSKTYLDAEGKKLADQQKEIPKKIDATRKAIRDTLDAWKDEVRAPLTAWEKAEEDRIAGHKERLEAFRIWETECGCLGLPEIRLAIGYAEAIKIDASWDEFAADAAAAKDRALSAMRSALATAEKREAEAAELARLRAEAAAREQADREARIAQEAAERARLEAEAKAAAEKTAADDAARREREATERRELELKLQAERAERRAAEAEAKAKKDAADRAAAEAAAAAKREADKAHRAKINRTALADFISGGLSEEAAKLAVELIAAKKVAHVYISY